jgi:RNA recognition motif
MKAHLSNGQGPSRKLYFPDYIVVVAGLPVLVTEAKAPDEDLQLALDEARLYGSELNALFPSQVNPCIRVVACNGSGLWSAPTDCSEPDVRLVHTAFSLANADFARFVDLCKRAALQEHVDRIRRGWRKPSYHRAVSLVGGSGFQQEELPPNTFGATIAGDYGHVFSPRTKEDRALIVRHAYIASLRRQRYVEPIDRLIRGAVAPSTGSIRVFENTGTPDELTGALSERRQLENQVLLLVGSVGSGKSTFVDYVSLVALPDDLRDKSVWVRVNLNDAPLSADAAYSWLARTIVADLREQMPHGVDVDDLAVLQKIFAPELNAFRKGALSLLDSASTDYRTRLTDELIRLQRDPLVFAKCLARYICAGPGKLLVVVLDNCDKRTRDEQLMMFQVAQWVQTEFRSLVILPLRDVTYERHRHEPPLDTALKGLVFRIEPPPFSEVLQARVRLVLDEMRAQSATANTLSYVLPNGIKVSYPASDQANYLASILRSLYEHDRFVRRVMTGLAGRDVRRALEIFLDFCTSGHIGEDEIYKIRFFEGRYVLPLSVVARVLLRMERRFYDGTKAYIKNLVQCVQDDPLPDHFVRLSILHWLEKRQRDLGPAGVIGFHAVGRIIQDLVQLGHDGNRVHDEILFLAKEGCIVPEHLRLGSIAEGDLVKLTASGLVHLQLMASPDYLAACAEDTWVSDVELARRVANRIGSRGLRGHFSRLTTAKNAAELVDYLRDRAAERIDSAKVYIDPPALLELETLREAEAAVRAAEIDVSTRLYVGNIPFDCREASLRQAFEAAGIDLVGVSIPSASSDKNRGFAFVQVRDGKAAMEALDCRDLAINGRRLVINEAHTPKDTRGRQRPEHTEETPTRLYVGNLSLKGTKESVLELFADHGFRAVDVYIPLDRATNAPRGFAFVSMASPEDATGAIGALNGSIVDGRSIIVRPARPRALGDRSEGNLK